MKIIMRRATCLDLIVIGLPTIKVRRLITSMALFSFATVSTGALGDMPAVSLEQQPSSKELEQASRSDVPKTKKSSAGLQLVVIDAYAEIHSGPSDGYPVFYVVEQGESIRLLTRRPDWFEVALENGVKGWVPSKNIARTLHMGGAPADLPEISFGDYLARSLWVGFSTGQYTSGELRAAEHTGVALGYRALSWLSIEGELERIQGDELQGNAMSLGLTYEPWSQYRVSPLLTLGYGRISIKNQPKFEESDKNRSDLVRVGLGVNIYIARRFVFRTEYRYQDVSTAVNNKRLSSWEIGFSTFF